MTNRRTKISPKSGRGLGHVTSTIFGSTVGYPSDSLASCLSGYIPYPKLTIRQILAKVQFTIVLFRIVRMFEINNLNVQ